MSNEEFQLSTILSATPEEVFTAWLSSGGHSQMTGSEAEVEVEVSIGGDFTAWDGYIWGKTLEMDPHSRILQTWRTSEFPEDSPDSRIEILLEKDLDGTKITLIHTDIPEGQGNKYKEGWEDHYFTPMRAYFSK